MQQIKDEIILKVKVIPKASKTVIVGWENDELKIRLAAVPEKGEANDELIRFLSKHYAIPKSSITILSGQTSRYKKLLLKVKG